MYLRGITYSLISSF